MAKERNKKKANRARVKKLKKELEAWEKEHKQRANLLEADVLQKLGFISRHIKKGGKAIEYYRKAHDMLKKVEPSPEHKIGEVLQAMGTASQIAGKYEVASEKYTEAFRTLTKVLDGKN